MHRNLLQTQISGEDDWMIKDNPDVDGIPPLNKDLTHEVGIHHLKQK